MVGTVQTRSRREPVTFEQAEGSIGQISGYAAVFNEETLIKAEGGVAWRERLHPDAFNDVLAGGGERDTIGAFNHKAEFLLGRTSSGTLRLSRDAHGLRYVIDLPDTGAGRDVQALVKRGDLKGSSFRFAVSEGGFSIVERGRPGEPPLLQVNRIKSLMDVGPVSEPAYEGTTVSARSVPDVLIEALRQDEMQRAAEEATKPDDVKARESMRAALDTAKAWRT
jgi:HK97 family phage prohead protease